MPHDHITLSTGNSRPGDVHPLTVEVTRNGIVESRHRGSAAIVDVSGKVQDAWGDIRQPTYPRSAIKAIQALPMVESGAAAEADFTDAEVALACSSHNGEEGHTETAAAMLQKLGLGEQDLECGSHWPYHEDTTLKMAKNGVAPSQLHNNCSGKHCGMLALAKQLGGPIQGYVAQTHGVQQRIMGAMEQMCGVDLSQVQPGIDGCSAPNWPIPLENLAYGFARIADPKDLPTARAEAVDWIKRAVFANPFMVAGTGRFCTEVMKILGNRAFIKTGAEGVFCASLPEYGIGIALKCDDGATRGSETMMAALLRHVGVLEAGDMAAMEPWLNPQLKNRAKRTVGDIRPAAAWLSF
jgi:L-asparaginase II